MHAIKIFLTAALLTGIGVTTADASIRPQVSSVRTHAELAIGSQKVTLSSQQSQSKSRARYVCSVIRGVSYGVALVGLQSMTISLPSMTTVVGVPVAAVAAGVGALSAGFGIATMIANDKLCTWGRIMR